MANNRFDLGYYGEVEMALLKLSVALKWASKHFLGYHLLCRNSRRMLAFADDQKGCQMVSCHPITPVTFNVVHCTQRTVGQ